MAKFCYRSAQLVLLVFLLYSTDEKIKMLKTCEFYFSRANSWKNLTFGYKSLVIE